MIPSTTVVYPPSAYAAAADATACMTTTFCGCDAGSHGAT
jgi:hypothetical protein